MLPTNQECDKARELAFKAGTPDKWQSFIAQASKALKAGKPPAPVGVPKAPFRAAKEPAVREMTHKEILAVLASDLDLLVEAQKLYPAPVIEVLKDSGVVRPASELVGQPCPTCGKRIAPDRNEYRKEWLKKKRAEKKALKLKKEATNGQ